MLTKSYLQTCSIQNARLKENTSSPLTICDEKNTILTVYTTVHFLKSGMLSICQFFTF